MTGETQGFVVKPEELLSVADSIADLYDEVSGQGGNISGSYQQFQRDGAPSHMSAAWASVFEGDNGDPIFTEAYEYQYNGMNAKYTAIMEQLQLLEQACRTTAQTYLDRDQDNTTNINQVDPGAGPSGPSEQV
jgi:uncharacterized protein YukE